MSVTPSTKQINIDKTVKQTLLFCRWRLMNLMVLQDSYSQLTLEYVYDGIFLQNSQILHFNESPLKLLSWPGTEHELVLNFPIFFAFINHAGFGLNLANENKSTLLAWALAKYCFSLRSEPGLLFCWCCAQIPVCSHDAGSNDSEVPICHSCT